MNNLPFARYAGKYVQAQAVPGNGAPRIVKGECVVSDGEFIVKGFPVIPATIKPTIDTSGLVKEDKPKGLGAPAKSLGVSEETRRKGLFLTRFFTNPSGPIVNEAGGPTRLAKSASAWGEAVPRNQSDVAKLVAVGRQLLADYEAAKNNS
jgi:hypothetical protein